jgi:uncharacterized protein (TIGR03382 family)
VTSADADCTDSGEASLTEPTGDCDDAEGDVHPGAEEVVADEVDQDCDGTETCYEDGDDDSYRPDSTSTVSSADPDCDDSGEASGAESTGDCDDTDASVYPGAPEVVGDGIDQDCDSTETCYSDEDNDGWRPDASSTTLSTDGDCNDIGEALGSDPEGDCDDTNASIRPGVAEVPGDQIDQNCDGMEDCYTDADDDGWRPDSTSTTSSADVDCVDSGEATSEEPDGDCDDTDPSVYPGAPEITGDGVDQDCDGTETCYEDADDDGWRPDEESTVPSADGDCDDSGEAVGGDGVGDCDDADADISPGAEELPADGIDQNCDDADDCYSDLDADGWRTDVGVPGNDLDCEDEGEASAEVPGVDCDDTDPDVNPAAVEEPGDEVDQDCDGQEDCYTDADDDGWRPDGGALTESADADCQDSGEARFDEPDGDCDDEDPNVHPEADEVVADGVDQDCDGGDDCYPDLDADGWRPDDGSTVSNGDLDCDDDGEAGLEVESGDCDDDDPERFPGAEEIAEDGVDQDCDGDDAKAWIGGAPCGCNTTAPAMPMATAGLAILLAAARRRKGV